MSLSNYASQQPSFIQLQSLDLMMKDIACFLDRVSIAPIIYDRVDFKTADSYLYALRKGVTKNADVESKIQALTQYLLQSLNSLFAEKTKSNETIEEFMEIWTQMAQGLLNKIKANTYFITEYDREQFDALVALWDGVDFAITPDMSLMPASLESKRRQMRNLKSRLSLALRVGIEH